MTSDASTPAPRPRRDLNLLDRLVRVPIGFLYLGILALLALPVFLYMTALYWTVQAAALLKGRARGAHAERRDRDERVA